jgi:2-polyprenyl-3-methyl-5-hydroxy-6-metoxy-1,4-benzoquinol methylase
VSDSAGMRRTCPVCRLDDYRLLFRPPRSPGPVVKCRNCGFVFVNPVRNFKSLILDGPVLGDYPSNLITSSNPAFITGSWEEPIIQEYMSEEEGRRRNARQALALIAEETNRPANLLDIGCFCGLFLSVASEAGWSCFGIEPLVMPAIYARSHFGLHVTTGTLKADSFARDFFDVVTCFQVFEHLLDPELELSMIASMLKPGGIILIEVPNIESVWVSLLRGRHRHFVRDHVSFFSAGTLTFLLRRMGFRVLRTEFPTRTMSVGHFLTWLERTIGMPQSVRKGLPSGFLNRAFRINLGDIVTVVAEKEGA